MSSDSTNAPEDPGSSRLQEAVLVLVTVVWGATFLITQTALRDSGPFLILGVRFGIGAATLAALFGKRLRHLSRNELIGGAIIGLASFLSFAGQTVGLQFITSSKSAFITALYVPIVPLLQLFFLRKAPRFSAWIGITLSFAGLMVLSWSEEIGLEFGIGEWLTLAGALGAALIIILISKWAAESDPMRLATVQLAVVSLLSFIAIPLVHETTALPGMRWFLAVSALGILGSAFALGAMTWAQKTVSATRATVIYSLEPVWAGIFGAMAGEAMYRNTVAGSAMILLGLIVSEIRWKGRMERRTHVSGTIDTSADDWDSSADGEPFGT